MLPAIGMLAVLLGQAEVEVVVKGPPPQAVKGEVVGENLRGLTLKAGKGTTAYAWHELESVAGMPTRDHVARLKSARKASWCPDCKGGLGILVCPDCLATGTFHTRSTPCADCSGTGAGAEPCTAKGCKAGKVECPGSCLKRNAGIWQEGPGGAARIFHHPNGTMGITERHLGEILDYKEVPPFPLKLSCLTCRNANKVCSDCRRSGTFVERAPRSLGDCPQCVRGEMPCLYCAGLGKRPCQTCLGAKTVPVPESAIACGVCVEGIVRCGTCGETGVVGGPPRDVRMSGLLLSLRPDIRRALESLDESRLAATERITLRDGRAWEGAVVGPLAKGIVFAMPSGGGIRIAPVLLRHGYRLERLAGPPLPAARAPGASEAPEAAPATLPPAPAGPDTVVLKDGTAVHGKVVAKSDTLIMVQTADGKFVKIEASKVAEIRSKPK